MANVPVESEVIMLIWYAQLSKFRTIVAGEVKVEAMLFGAAAVYIGYNRVFLRAKWPPGRCEGVTL